MTESRHVTPRWRRIAGTLLFDGSLAAAALGIARMVFGSAIDVPPGPIPLGSGGPWPAFALAAVLFVAAASLRPPRRGHEPAAIEPTAAGGGDGPEAQALGPGAPDLPRPTHARTPIPHRRGEP